MLNILEQELNQEPSMWHLFSPLLTKHEKIHLHILSKPIDIHAYVWMRVQMYVYVHHYM